MTLRLAAIAAYLCLALGCAAGPAASAAAAPDPARERARLEARERDFHAALAARDAEGAAAYFAEDAALHVANLPPVEGRDAIRQFYGNVFRFMTASSPTPETLRVSASGDMAYGTGRVINAFSGDQGPVQYAGKYLLVWERRDGEWQVALYAVSNDRADPARSQ